MSNVGVGEVGWIGMAVRMGGDDDGEGEEGEGRKTVVVIVEAGAEG